MRGASLVGMLMIVVVLGALSATAVVGLNTLNSGNSQAVFSTTPGHGTVGTGGTGGTGGRGGSGGAGSACQASADAARSASTLFFVNRGGQSYPTNWADLTTSNPAIYTLTKNVAVNSSNPNELDGRGWKLILTGGGPTQPTFTCR